jgi:MFS transporter, OCT family, solute carrier family 22 (organic cation transporter), member 18
MEKQTSTALWVTYINIALYALCYQLQRPVEPFLVQRLVEQADGSDSHSVTQTYGHLQSFFSTIQTIGSPLVGILLDRVGIRKASALVFAASAASYLLLANAQTLPLLFASKIPTALQHAFLVAQAVAATSCQNNEAARAQALGRMTTAYTIGATLGPAMGGYLAEHGDLFIGAQFAVIGSLLSVALSLIFLSDDVARTTKAKDDANTNGSDGNDSCLNLTGSSNRSFRQAIQHSIEIAMRAALWPLLLVKVISGVASSMYDTTLPMVLVQQLHFDPADLGLNMSYSMFAGAIFGVVGIGAVTRALGALGMAQATLLLRPLVTCYVAFVISTSLATSAPAEQSTSSSFMAAIESFFGIGSWIHWQIVAGTVVRGLAAHALATGITTQATGIVAPNEQGALLGLEHCLFSLARIGGPAFGTYILLLAGKSGLGAGSFWSVATACSVVDLTLLAVLVVHVTHKGSHRDEHKQP